MESTTTFKADIADLKKGIQEAAAQIKLAKAEFNAAAAGMDEWSNSADGLSAKVNSLTTILDAQQSILTSLKDQYSLVCQEQGENSKAATDLQAKIFNQQTAISKTEQELGRYKDALKSGEIGMASLADEVELANSEFRNATAGMSDWSSTSEGLQAKLKQLNTVLDSQEKSLDTLESEYERVAEEQGRNSKEAVQLQTAINNQKAAITNTKAEISQYSDALNDVESGSKALEQELKSLDSEIDSIEKDIKLANAEFDNAVAGISDWEGSVVGLNAKLENLDTVLESEKGILENLNRQYELTVEAQGSASDAARDLEIRINEQEAAVKNVEAETAKYESKLDDLDNEYQSVTSSTDKLAQSIDKNLTPSFQDIINTVAGFKLVTKAIDSVKTAITGAFERVDTMESFSNVMTLMTGSAKEADAALADITETVTGTAYGLVSAARGVQNFVTSGVALGDATDMIGTYTDAVSTYAGGTNMALETVTNALSDMSSKGQAYTREINSIAQTGIPAWAIYAEAVDASIAEVKDAVSNGQVSATDFIGVLTGALDEGTQSFASVAGAAQTAGASWTGTFDNMKADVTKSVTDIVKSIDTSLVGNSLPSMREGLRMTSRSFASLLKDIGSFITGGIRVLAPALKTVSNNMDLLTSALKVGAGAFIAYKSAMMIQSTISAVKNAMAASNIVMTAATALNSANTASIGANMVAIHTRTAAKAAGMAVDAKGNIVTASGTAASILEAAAVKASAFALTAKTVAVQFLTGNLHIVTAAQHLWNAAMAANPIGAIVAVVAALVAGIVVLVKWLTRSSDAAKELSAKNKELAESAEQAADAVESSKQAHEDALTSIKAESGAATDLAQKIRELSAVENKSAQDKALLNTYVGMLNDSMEDLGLQYDIENDKLNMTTDSIQRKIDAYKDQSEVQAAQERYTDLLEEQIELETQLENVTVTQMGEVEKAYRQKEISSKEYKKAVKSLAETEDQLNASLASVKDELSQVDAGIKKSLESTSETATKLTERFHALSGSASDMTEAIHESSDAYKENLKAIKNETDASKKLADKVTELSKKENKSAQDKALLKSYVNMLNDSMEDLNLLYDEEADALNMSANAVMDKVEAYGTLDQAAASQDRLNTILTEQLAIEEDLNAIHDLRGDWQKAYEEGKVSTEEYNAAISDLIEKEGELEGKHGELGAAYDEVAVSIAEGMATATNSVAEATQAQKDSIDGLAEKYTELSDKVTNAFEEIELEAAISTDKLTKTLEKNTEISEGWGENLNSLANRTIDENGRMLDQGLIDQLREAGPEYAKTVEALATASDTELVKLNDAYEAAGGSIAGIVGSAWNVTDEAALAAEQVANATNQTLTQKIEEADFQNIGSGVVDGYVSGITEKISDVENAAQEMAEKGQEAAKKADDSHSPSQKYKGFGENAIEGYILGLQNKEGDLQSAMTDVLTNAAQVFEDSGDMMGEGFGNSLKSSMETSLAGVEAVVHSQLGGLTSTFASSFTQINVSGLQFGTTLKTAIQSSLTGVNSMAKSQLTSMLNSFSSNFTLIQTRTTSWGNNTKTNINNILSSVTGTVKSKLTTMASNFSSTYAAILSNQSSWGSNMQSSASSIISSVVNSMTSIMSTAISSFQNIGVQIVQGLWNGIASRDSWIRSNVASFVNGLVQAANNQLGIHSPSRVFMEMGAFSGEGYGIGLMNSLENVKKNLNSALQMVVPDLPQQKGVAEPTSSQSASGKTIVVNQTINSPRAINRLDIYRQTKNAVLLAGRT